MSSIPSIVVFTDVGVKDIDDEILLQYLLENKKDLELHIVFMGSDGVSPEKAIQICSFMMSIPVTISDTGCST